MIDEAIVGYMQDHTRLVVPQFGAFLRKEDTGEVVFMEFLKNDDHELTSYLKRLYSLSDEEALQAIGNFVAEVKERIMYKGGYLIERLGILRPGPNNIYRLDYDPQAAPDRLPQERSKVAQDEAETICHDSQDNVGVIAGEETESIYEQPAPISTEAEVSADGKSIKDNDFRDIVWDESLKGLSYGKPDKSARRSGNKRMDSFMIIAIIVAIAAIGALIYGIMNDEDGSRNLFGGKDRVEVIDEPASDSI